MKNVLNFIDTWGTRIMLPLVLIVFFKTCTTNGKVEKLEKNMVNRVNKVDSTVNQQPIPISKEEMVKILKETPNWKTLELEELSDKNRIPINKLKNDEK